MNEAVNVPLLYNAIIAAIRDESSLKFLHTLITSCDMACLKYFSVSATLSRTVFVSTVRVHRTAEGPGARAHGRLEDSHREETRPQVSYCCDAFMQCNRLLHK